MLPPAASFAFDNRCESTCTLVTSAPAFASWPVVGQVAKSRRAMIPPPARLSSVVPPAFLFRLLRLLLHS
jgi:hypothetical protein